MKRLLIFALVLALALPLGGCAGTEEKPTTPTHSDATLAGNVDYGPHRPVGIYAVEEQLRDDDFWKQTTPIADRNKVFYTAQEELFDYFYNLWGFDVSINLSDTGRFSDKEMLHSVCIRLNMSSEDGTTTVFSKAKINAAAKKYYGQTIESFTGCDKCSYNSQTEMYTWDNNCSAFPGNFMVLRQLRVQEDGLCVGIFDRSHEKYYTGEFQVGNDNTEIHPTILNGSYDDLSRVDTVVVTFREGKSKDDGYHLQILSIYPYTGLGSNTK